ncbi:hypothetical protein HA402_014470 [Bradysia odoriphaga]|nr:hypothetical protein HA402_014470 [Bradysia odoriphaga]
MPEHTPAPTPHRAVYGFAVFLLFKTLLILYLFWAFVPDDFLENTLGLTYLPDKYFAMFLPMVVMMGLMFFAFLIYPALNLSITADVDHVSTIRDNYSIRRCKFQFKNGKLCDRRVDIDPTAGWEVSEFCALHKSDGQLDSDVEEECKIENYCDCSDKRRCVIAKDPNHVRMLHYRKTVPSVRDLDISEVCRSMFE